MENALPRYSYPCFLLDNEGQGFISHVFSPSIIADGENKEDAVAWARLILLDMVPWALKDKVPFELPDPDADDEDALDRAEIRLDESQSLKIDLVNAMIESGIRPAELARALGITRRSVAVLVNPHYRTDVATLVRAVAVARGAASQD